MCIDYQHKNNKSVFYEAKKTLITLAKNTEKKGNAPFVQEHHIGYPEKFFPRSSKVLNKDRIVARIGGRKNKTLLDQGGHTIMILS